MTRERNHVSLDDLIVWNRKGRWFTFRRLIDFYLMMAVVVICGIIQNDTAFVVSCVMVVPLLLFMFKVMWTEMVDLRMSTWMDRRMEVVPWSIQHRAFDLYGYGRDAVLAAIECHESHIPGDCPLCGAE